MMHRRWAISALVATVLLLSALTFYGLHESYSKRVAARFNLITGSANAIKHASAASRTYRILRRFGISTGTSQSITEGLGYANEFGETFVKFGAKDDMLEMVRDLHNNSVGIAVERWIEHDELGDCQRSHLFAMLVNSGDLLHSKKLLDVEPQYAERTAGQSSVSDAIGLHQDRRAAVASRAWRSLEAAPPCLRS